MAPRPLVPAALLIAVSAISFAAIFFRLAQPTHPLVSAGVRLAIASLLLAPWTLRSLRAGRLTPRLVRHAVVAGLFYGLHFGSWVASLELTTIAASVTLVTATPLLLALHGLLTGKDRPTRRLWIALGLAAVGVTTIGGTDLGRGVDALLGDGLALLGCLAMAGYLLVGRRLGGELDVLGFSGIAVAVGALSLGVAAVGTGVDLSVSREALGWLAASALVPQLIGHNLLTWTLQHARPTVVGMATVGEPVGASLLGLWVLGEAVSGVTLLGCGVTVAAVGVALWGAER